MAVGDPDIWNETYGGIPRFQTVHFSRFEELSQEMLRILSPNLIVSPVVATTFDCIDVANVLSRLMFNGAYRALTQNMPNPAMIRREVRLLYPALDFDLCEIEDCLFRVL